MRIERRPERVLTIGSEAVSALYAAGAADRITARAGELGAPVPGAAGDAVATVEVLCDANPSTEAIVAAGVDLVIGYGLFATTATQLETAGIASLVLNNCCHLAGKPQGPASFDAIYADVDKFGRLFGTSDHAARSIADLKRRVQAVTQRVDGARQRTAASAYFFGQTPSTHGNREIVTAMMAALGLRNVFGDVDRDFIEANTDQLIARDPDVLLLSYGFGERGETLADVKRKFLRLPGTHDMTAVRSGRIIGVCAAHKSPSPAAVDGLERLADQLNGLP